jgi:predicted secreted Zn-dependent protease
VNEMEPPKWRKSSRCSNGTCVEVARVNDQYLIRDSKQPEAAPLTFTADEWTAFVAGVNAGEFRF